MSRLTLILTWLFLFVFVSGMIWVGCRGATPQEQAGSARSAALETDLRLVKDAVDAYFAFSGTVPTEDSRLPPAGEYAPIDFDASFTQGGNTMSLYPDFLIVLPRHHDEGIWRINHGMQVSVDIDPVEY